MVFMGYFACEYFGQVVNSFEPAITINNMNVCVCVYGIFGVNSKFILFQRDSSNSRHLCESLMVGEDGCFWQL